MIYEVRSRTFKASGDQTMIATRQGKITKVFNTVGKDFNLLETKEHETVTKAKAWMNRPVYG